MKPFFVVIISLLFSALCCAQAPWANILNAPTGSGAGVGLAIRWDLYSGIPGGVPSGSWTQSGATINPTGADQTSQINTALSACTGSNGVVHLGNGSFTINSALNVPSSCTLRGNGAQNTILNVHGNQTGAINLGSGSPSNSGAVAINSGFTAGSTSIVLSSVSGVSVGKYLVVTELNDSYVTPNGGEGTATWVDGWSDNGARARGQIVEVEGVSGTTVTISPALYTSYTHSPQAVPFSATKYAGVEDLQILGNNTGYTDDIFMTQCAYCWVKGVEVNYTDGDFVEASWSFRGEIRNNYFSNAFTHAPGTTDSDIFIDYKTSGMQIVNNIVERSHAGIMLNWGAAGNVIGYNFTTGEFDTNSYNFLIGGIDFHGAHPQFNLVEGNVATNLYPDQVWGSSSNQTLLRNWFKGSTLACNPLTGRGTITCSTIGAHGNSGVNGWYTYQVSVAEDIAHLSTYYNIIGDVTGSPEQQSVLSVHNPIVYWQSGVSGRDGYSNKTWNMAFGFGESNDDGTGDGCSGGTAPCHGTQAYSTATIYKVYTHANGAVNCIIGGVTSSCGSAIPASFFLSGKPSWWTSGMPFPAIGSDLSGYSGPGGHTSLTASNPAQNCFYNILHGSTGGAGSPLPFDENLCYAATLPPPNNLNWTLEPTGVVF